MNSYRNKAAAARSGIDPDGKRLAKLHAIRSSQERQLKKAQEAVEKSHASIEHFWWEVETACKAQDEMKGE